MTNHYTNPIECYNQDLLKDGFLRDKAQQYAVENMQRLFDDLTKDEKTESVSQSLFSKVLKRAHTQEKKTIKGLYFWGGVGRGKTYIVDTFYNCLPFEEKVRIHFHSFMRGVHKELRLLDNVQDPLSSIAKEYASKYKVICFDEFHVSDITDAMLLGNLFKELFKLNVVLVATSNEHPDELYTNGLQRGRFLPAIELIKSHTDVINVDSGVDYRFRVLEKAEIYHSPLDEQALINLSNAFEQLTLDDIIDEPSIAVEGRNIDVIKQSVGIVWFDFKDLCDGPRGPSDYIEIARTYQTVLLSNLPVMDMSRDDNTKRFMTLIDEFYDRNVKLIISAEAQPEELYTGTRLKKSFNRIISRLQEMGTKEYLSRSHISD